MRSRLLAGAAAVLLLAACERGPTVPAWPEAGPGGGAWKTWVLADAASVLPPAPPAAGSEAARQEVEEILRLQRDAAGLAALDLPRWSQATLPWTHEAIDLLEFYWFLLPDVRTASPARSARIMALLHVASYDAMVATWRAKYHYQRPPPHATDARVQALGSRGEVPSYPSEHAAAAGVAVEVLSAMFPQEDRARFEATARRAGEARIASGQAYRSDVDAGYELGRAVARQVLERARGDGADAAWAGSMPADSWAWRPTPPRRVRDPFDATAGSWRTWVLERGDQYRLPPPPMPGSPAFERDLEELRRMPAIRTVRQADAARFWATDAPSAGWELFAEEEIRRRNLPALHAARAQALVSIALYDAFVAAWDSKYHYWLLRPVSADTTLQPIFSTPPFPSYPSGHSTISGAAAEVFAYLFPDRAAHYHSRAHEASMSRVWGMVHYRFDVVQGEELGRKVGEAVVRRARQDGSGR
jgi:membrane-associated phospholipid phosphatase